MKKIIFVIGLCFIFLTGTAQAESVTLVWTPSISQDVVSYRVYKSLIEGLFATGPECNAIIVIDGTDECVTKTVISDLIAGYRYYFIVTAIDAGGNESDQSNMVSITIDPENANPASIGTGNIETTIQ